MVISFSIRSRSGCKAFRRFPRVLLQIGLRRHEQARRRPHPGWLPTKLEGTVLGQLTDDMVLPVLLQVEASGAGAGKGQMLHFKAFMPNFPDQISQKVEGRKKNPVSTAVPWSPDGNLSAARPSTSRFSRATARCLVLLPAPECSAPGLRSPRLRPHRTTVCLPLQHTGRGSAVGLGGVQRPQDRLGRHRTAVGRKRVQRRKRRMCLCSAYREIDW